MSQKRRIFIAVSLPEDLKRRLLDFQKKWEYLFPRHSSPGASKGGPVRWTKQDSLHLTLIFIGYADEQEIYEICRLTKETVKKYEPFSIIFEKILYGPPGKPPRMIWLKGKASHEISKIKNELEEVFVSSENLRAFRIETRPFSLHITLARIHPHTLKNYYESHINLMNDNQNNKELRKEGKGVGVNMGQWHSLEQKPELEQDFKAIVPVASIDVMESDLKRDGAEYTILESCPLGEN